ncbi:hypothetical protein B0H16DRAFT_1517306 [Mycena metata]|uniref:Uncharacterized protein n=1 Tax=Mycena metata TaxID=1033252 RepID=A0AAD7JR32_9AGAR|nr:hypothetical protein B0H16DRAFT_1517306 [Mycena metata]
MCSAFEAWDLKRFEEDENLHSHLLFLVNTSGSGKTRLTFEGLCQDWGFYFSATDNASGYVAQDMTAILETRLPHESRFVQDLSPWTDFTRRLKSSDNQQIAAHHFNAVLLARLLNGANTRA